jgi:hypothetical protein
MRLHAVLAVVAVAVLFAGCLKTVGSAGASACAALSGKDQDHCYQGIAVKTGNTDLCAYIQAADFKQYGSKPPKDKCYLMIAENTGDKSICDKIVGGTMSYTKAECLDNIRTGKKTN